jgi:hypothetical protein
MPKKRRYVFSATRIDSKRSKTSILDEPLNETYVRLAECRDRPIIGIDTSKQNSAGLAKVLDISATSGLDETFEKTSPPLANLIDCHHVNSSGTLYPH